MGTFPAGSLRSAGVPDKFRYVARNHTTSEGTPDDEIVRIDVHLPKSLRDRIKTVGKAHDRSLSAQVRVAINEHVSRHEEEAA